jgi:hypothetical protein
MTRHAVVCAWLATLAVPLHAQWPQWRGPNGLGISSEKDIPIEWSVDERRQPAEGRVRREARRQRRRQGSPAVADGTIYIRGERDLFAIRK